MPPSPMSRPGLSAVGRGRCPQSEYERRAGRGAAVSADSTPASMCGLDPVLVQQTVGFIVDLQQGRVRLSPHLAAAGLVQYLPPGESPGSVVSTAGEKISRADFDRADMGDSLVRFCSERPMRREPRQGLKAKRANLLTASGSDATPPHHQPQADGEVKNHTRINSTHKMGGSFSKYIRPAWMQRRMQFDDFCRRRGRSASGRSQRRAPRDRLRIGRAWRGASRKSSSARIRRRAAHAPSCVPAGAVVRRIASAAPPRRGDGRVSPHAVPSYDIRQPNVYAHKTAQVACRSVWSSCCPGRRRAAAATGSS